MPSDTKSPRRPQTFNFAATFLGVGKAAVKELVALGELAAIDLASPGDPPKLRIDVKELEAFLERRRVLPTEPTPTVRRRTTRRDKVKTFFS